MVFLIMFESTCCGAGSRWPESEKGSKSETEKESKSESKSGNESESEGGVGV